MPTPIVNFAALQTQGNPGTRGIIPAIKEGMDLFYYPQAKKEELEKQRLANALAQINLQFSPEMSEAELQYKKAQAPHMNAQTNLINQQSQYYPDDIKSQIAHRLAQTGLVNEESKYYSNDMESRLNERDSHANLLKQQAYFYPLQQALGAFKDVNNPRNSRFGAAYEMSRTLNAMPPAARFAWISGNSEAYTNMLNMMSNKALEEKNNSGQMNPALEKVITKYFPDLTKENLTFNPNEMEKNALINSGIGRIKDIGTQSLIPDMQQLPFPKNMPMPNQGMAMNDMQNIEQNTTPPMPALFNTSPEDAQRIRDAANISANNALVTTKTRNQLEGGIQVAEMINDPTFQKHAISASLYAGAAGKGKAAIDALLQKNPNSYMEYLSFMNDKAVFLLNRVKQLDGMASTNQQREELWGLYNKTMDKMTSNPEQFLKALNNFGETIDIMGRAVEKSANPLGGQRVIPEFNPISVSKEINNKTSKKSGMVTLVSPSGKMYEFQEDKAQQILSSHPQFKRM
jgi:hypothetical protein